MQRVTNCVLVKDGKVLLLQKPKRGWWVAPGGKMEQGESVREACIREYREETGIYLKNPKLKGVFTIVVKNQEQTVSEWMMFTFFADQFAGENVPYCEEGKLEWHPLETIHQLPMAPGDYHILDYALKGSGVMYGTFIYTEDFDLLSYRLDPS
ncbi:8-oxo-dGTP diphosphatase [Parageobacillus thermoglucosidasius]|uniref:NUDIX hydrolase n=2 Tax=Parageobacillus thermoglucosidasius TaxID=1426 RepID=A0AAN0YS96_PARTM|nr:8-oxo-dGTP diphosphatase [Parageobacillus thermoglucosidasius]REK56495.1 MAG: 8-oxo-dGTP diphosphatase [Geobacillus sp.]ALF11959.1 NUDIX hydrolase [Parageobacillus thermoglucosidasius]ANZ32044.1 NUDIX hydrolase [Parageobacillus thermoglucosidasius]APM82779.1 NUDIX hydrolase [Parageobacillus thermoglucosidasius]EID45538.1 NUDIX hydrolase family protein [Parageobacillus thermoglucosidasius TNO-09.020]